MGKLLNISDTYFPDVTNQTPHTLGDEIAAVDPAAETDIDGEVDLFSHPTLNAATATQAEEIGILQKLLQKLGI